MKNTDSPLIMQLWDTGENKPKYYAFEQSTHGYSERIK